MTDAELQIAEAYLARSDTLLGRLIRKQSLRPRSRSGDYFAALCRSIIGQQVSVAAASAIFKRLEAVTQLQPSSVANLSEDEIKQVGLSKQKAGYLRDLAQHFAADPGVYRHLDEQSDETVIKELTEVKGIGVWTAQMFLIFTLQRPDVFAPDDVGLQRGMQLLYGWDDLPPKQKLEEVAKKWSPYRTVASLHLWQSLSNTPEG